MIYFDPAAEKLIESIAKAISDIAVAINNLADAVKTGGQEDA